MADIRALVHQCQEKAKLRPVLPLGQSVRLGDVGYLEGDSFRYLGSVDVFFQRAVGRPLEGDTIDKIELMSEQGVTLHPYGKTEPSAVFGALANGSARVEATFSSEKSFLMTARDVLLKRMREPIRFIDAMMAAYKEGSWDEDHCFIYEVGRAAHFTAVLAQQGGGSLLLSAEAGIAPGGVALADVAAGVSYKRTSGSLHVVVADKGVNAFFNAYRVRKKFLRDPKLQVAAAGTAQTGSKEILSILGDEDPFEPA